MRLAVWTAIGTGVFVALVMYADYAARIAAYRAKASRVAWRRLTEGSWGR